MAVKKQEKVINLEKDNFMYKLGIFNNISEKGIGKFTSPHFSLSKEDLDTDAVIVRSHDLNGIEFNSRVKAIGRAGAGVNNIPVSRCTEKGIVVFNTPGANANAVKELVLSGLFLTARNIVDGVEFVKSLKGSEPTDFKTNVEKNKSRFKGTEIKGKTLGVIGLGAIGTMVANSGLSLEMNVVGFDPFITVKNAWGLGNSVKRASSLDELLSSSDFISIHMPLTEGTQGIINKETLSKVKSSAVFLNFSRDGIINEIDILTALDSGGLRSYVTDFGSSELVKNKNVVCLPHLGASTMEAEDNCAIMISNQIKSYLEDGNIINSVNFPACFMERAGKVRLAIMNKNVPNMVSQITAVLAKEDLNIQGMMNKSRGEIAYNIVDLGNSPSDSLIEDIKSVDGILFLRVL